MYHKEWDGSGKSRIIMKLISSAGAFSRKVSLRGRGTEPLNLTPGQSISYTYLLPYLDHLSAIFL